MPIKSNKEDFIKKAIIIHGNKYDYSVVDYVNSKVKITIICKKHGIFMQIPNGHLNGDGCSKCVGLKKLNIEEFTEKSVKIHKDKYFYDKVNYINNHTKVIIICKYHGEFKQMPNTHLNGIGCPKCGGTGKSNTEEFIKKSVKIHQNKYLYNKVDYINNSTKVEMQITWYF